MGAGAEVADSSGTYPHGELSAAAMTSSHSRGVSTQSSTKAPGRPGTSTLLWAPSALLSAGMAPSGSL